jgi:dienelactone hydrolase
MMKRFWMTAWAAAAVMLCVVSVPQARAELKHETIEHKQGDSVQKSYLAVDDAAPLPAGSVGKQRPGVLVVPEWWGLNDYAKFRADELAKLGYVALAVDVYGNGDNSPDPKFAGQWAGKYKNDRALLRLRLNSALDVLAKRADVAPGKIAAIGYCFGGMCAIEMARAGSGVACVVSFHGSLDADSKVEDVNPIKAKVLVCHGAADPYEPPAQIADFQTEMNTHGADWHMVIYANAMHGFTNRNNATTTMKGVNYDEKADARSWREMRSFFDEVFK